MSDGKKSAGILARFFRKNPTSTLAAELHSRAINKPLFCHADLGGQLIRAYLSEPQSLARMDGEYQGATTQSDDVAVIDIAGPLVSRSVVGPSGTGPLSYEDIRNELDAAISDPSIGVVVMRLDSPGGEASQNIDIADHIYRSRGIKPIIAMVDDMAYSACYAIASACDQIWVTRTSGVGSVGVVSYHVDQSDFNAKLGVKVEYIHAGSRKVDFNPNSPLADDARARMQDEVNRLYLMFTECVARNRGMTLEAVQATEAGTFHGEKAIEIGFADKLGTFSDLLTFLSSEDYDAKALMQTGGAAKAVAQLEQAADVASAEPGAAGVVVDTEKVEQLHADIAAHKKEGMPAQQVLHSEIRAICTAAGVPEAAAHYITASTSAAQVREDLTSLLLAGEVEIESSQKVAVTGETPNTANQVNASSVYARRNNRK